MSLSILICGREPEATGQAAAVLAPSGHPCHQSTHAAQAHDRLRFGGYDLVVLCGRLADARAMQFLTQLRADPVTALVPVLVLGEEGDDVERMVALELGADDYLPPAPNPRELVLRASALLRRARPAAPEGARERYGPLEIDRAGFRAWVEGRPCELSAAEFRLLVALASPAGAAHHRARLRDTLEVGERAGGDRFIDARVARLREHLGPAGAQIVTVRGVGYRLEPRGALQAAPSRSSPA